MARKSVPVHVPLQMGFGFEVQDASGRTPEFLYRKADVYAALDVIQQAVWASVDVETTGLTDASSPVQLDVQQLRQHTASNVVRMRTMQARVPTVRGRSGPRENFAFDCDRMGPALTEEVARTLLSRKMFIAHNAGFDLYWIRLAEGRKTMPDMVVDTMLMTRLLKPELVLKRAELIADIRHITDVANADPVAAAAWRSLISGASGGSLADVVLAMFEVVVDKTYQKPGNWTGLLGFEHYDYAIDDVVWADRVLCELLGLDGEGDLYRAYLGQRARKFTVRLVEPQVPELVELRENGMPLNVSVGERYVARKRLELARKVDELISIEPDLEAHRDKLADPDAGLDEGLKQALAGAFEARGVSLRRTAATGAPQVGEKDLRACKAAQIKDSRPLFNAWVAVCRAKKSSNMALEVVGFAKRGKDGKVRSLLSHGPVTGRLSAAEPNCFTGDTEILTPDGWVRFDALSDAARVAQYRDGAIEFVAPLAHQRYPFVGELVHNRTSETDLLTTADHRCLLFSRTTGASHVVSAKDYGTQSLQRHAGFFEFGDSAPATHAELSLLALAAVSGDERGGALCLTPSTAGRFRRASAFAAQLGVEASEDDNLLPAPTLRFPVVSRLHLLRSKLVEGTAQGWGLGAWLLRLDGPQLSYFLHELAYWGGAYRDELQGVTYLTGLSASDADWAQIAFTLLGRRARIKTGAAQTTHGVKLLVSDGLDSPTTTTTQSTVPYRGNVYCVSVPSGFIVVRRNGAVMVTGNCQQFPRDQIFRGMCVSDTRAGMEEIRFTVTELNAPFLENVMGRPVSVGEEVVTDAPWAAVLFWADKNIPEWPAEARDELGRFIESHFTHTIVASDFGALDVRVGAALCIRSQREMLALAAGHTVPGPVQPPLAVVKVIQAVAGLLELAPSEAIRRLEAEARRYGKRVTHLEARLEKLKEELDAGNIARRKFFELRSELKSELLSTRLGYRLAQCLAHGMRRGEKEYSALRDAFVADIDIHTFTGMKLVGRDPMKEFEGLSVADRKALEKKLKKELGPRRQQGKIANLSLLYGMADAGFQEAAARGYDEHWSLEEAHDIRALWMDAYPEVELWHLWTECLQAGTVYVAEQGREKPVRTGWWMARTLAGRDIVAFGLNAALSYQDQSSGADILGLIMHRLKAEYPSIFSCSINQVHDEVVFCWPSEHHDEYLPIVEAVMVEEANSLTMPYGVPTAVSPACGAIWVKD